jgi:hypothetical protein
VLRRALAVLGERAPFRSVAERLAAVVADLDDVVSDLRHALDAVEEDPERLESVRSRRAALRDLCRKYGDDLTAVMAYHGQAEDRLRELESFDERAALARRERQRAVAEAAVAAEAVGRARRHAAPALAAAVEDRLRALAMPHAEVAVQVGEHDEDHPGDQIRFLLAANPGSPALPLSRVASGGELARSMLALRLVLAGLDGRAPNDHDERTLVFDEVDAGIGGAAAIAVGEALAALGARHQVLVVTHLPQVAALADRQVVVSKSVTSGPRPPRPSPSTRTERVDEIARMLSGEVTKHIFVTGGVASSLGKGLTASSLGRLLKARGLRVTMQKLDPYINVDPGTMNPFEHGEVFVTDDGGETDLDLGHYERFIDENLHRGLQRHDRVDLPVGARRRAPGRLPRQDRPGHPAHHRRDQAAHPRLATDDVDVVITEVGGTVGDIEILPFLEAIRQFRKDVGRDNVCYVHVRAGAVHRAQRASRRPSRRSTRSPSCAAAASSPTPSCAAARRRRATT